MPTSRQVREPSPDLLLARAAAIHDRHDRLLALELAAVVDGFRSLCPAACADPVFSEAWNRFASRRGSLLRALGDPALEAWIGQAQFLLGSPVLRACPGQHVPRILARFSVLMINLAGPGQGACEGAALVSGSGSVPLLFGAAQIRPSSARRALVHWAWDGSLLLRDEDGHALIELAADGRTSGTPGRGWSVEMARVLDGVHVFAEPRCVQHPGAPCAPGFPEAFARAWEELPSSTQSLLRLSTRSAGPRCDLHPLHARSWLGASAAPSAEELAHRLSVNLVGRCARVYRFDASSRLIDALGVPAQDDLVRTVAGELLKDETAAAESTLARILAVCEARQPAQPPSGPPATEPDPVLDLQPVLARAGIQVAEPDLWTERKNYQRNRAPAWRILDALLSLSPGEIARIRTALAEWPEPEVRHFGFACVDYHEGRFAGGTAHALACVEEDRACEDYWLLLALYARHLRHFEIFEDIVFGESRTDAILERVKRSLACTP